MFLIAPAACVEATDATGSAAWGASPPSPACKVNAKTMKLPAFPIAPAAFAEPMGAVMFAEPVRENSPIVNPVPAKPSALPRRAPVRRSTKWSRFWELPTPSNS